MHDDKRAEHHGEKWPSRFSQWCALRNRSRPSLACQWKPA